MNKLRDNPPTQGTYQEYNEWAWHALSDAYQDKFNSRTTSSLVLKARRMAGYESLSRNDDVVAAAIAYIIEQRCS